MSLSDPIGDMIARVKNAQARNHNKVELPSPNFKVKCKGNIEMYGQKYHYKLIGLTYYLMYLRCY